MEHPSRQRLPEVRRSVGRWSDDVNLAAWAVVRPGNGPTQGTRPTQGNNPALNVAINSP
jgi:hypothetical protein